MANQRYSASKPHTTCLTHWHTSTTYASFYEPLRTKDSFELPQGSRVGARQRWDVKKENFERSHFSHAFVFSCTCTRTTYKQDTPTVCIDALKIQRGPSLNFNKFASCLGRGQGRWRWLPLCLAWAVTARANQPWEDVRQAVCWNFDRRHTCLLPLCGYLS